MFQRNIKFSFKNLLTKSRSTSKVLTIKMKIVVYLIVLLSIFTVILPVHSDDDDEYENCEIKYQCISKILVDGTYHHCNRYKKVAYICDGEEIAIEDEFYEPPREEENEIDGAEEQVDSADGESEFVGIGAVMILITPCQRRYVPDQAGVCQAIF